MSTCQRSIKLINEETSRKIKLVQKTLEELCNFETEEYWNKISRLDTKLVNVLQGNETIIFEVNFSTRHRSTNQQETSQSLGIVGSK